MTLKIIIYYFKKHYKMLLTKTHSILTNDYNLKFIWQLTLQILIEIQGNLSFILSNLKYETITGVRNESWKISKWME